MSEWLNVVIEYQRWEVGVTMFGLYAAGYATAVEVRRRR